jgi:hypothetical protein
MKTCWDTLGIEKTTDLHAIGRARRSLIRQCHPDLASLPAEKEERTNRSMEVNAAYDEAVKQAMTLRSILAASKISAAAPKEGRARRVFAFAGRLTPQNECFVAIALVLLFTVKSFVYLFLGLAALTLITINAAVIGLLDLALVKLVLRPAFKIGSLVKPAFRDGNNAVICLSLMLLNMAVLRSYPAGIGFSIFGMVAARVASLAVASSIPLGLFCIRNRANPSSI